MTELASPAGYLFVAERDDGPTAGAEAGRVLSTAGRGPPWIVVHHRLDRVGAIWPGRLWRVRIIEAATVADQRRHGGPPLASAGYTRAISVWVEEEEDAACLFGPHGAEVVRLLDAALNLDRAAAEQLAANRHPDADGARDRAWRTWLDRNGVAHDRDEDLSDTLMFGGELCDSPIKDGLLALYDVVFDRARAVDGDAATDSDEEDMWLLPPWNGACNALADAAMALGAPDIVRAEDRDVLLAGWRAAAVPTERRGDSH